MLILCGFEGCRGGNFSRPYRNFSPPPREFLPPPLWGNIIFHHRRPSALPELILKKSIPGAVKIMLPRRGQVFRFACMKTCRGLSAVLCSIPAGR